MRRINKRLGIEQAEDGRIYLIIGARRRRVISKTELRISVGEFIRGL